MQNKLLEPWELEHEQKLIEGYINRFYEKDETTYKPITDGVIDSEKYLKSKYRICWVLKEPYDDVGGGWSLTEKLKQNDVLQQWVKGSATWEPLVMITYSLLNGFIPYEILKHDISELAPSFQQIAYMNVGKISADTKSGNMAKEYEYWKPLLHWQLKQYAPQIIIFGNTFGHFQKDLNIRDEEFKGRASEPYIIKDGTLYINAYHPAQRTISKEAYVQGIIDVVKDNENEIVLAKI
jgi:hypothetical protein